MRILRVLVATCAAMLVLAPLPCGAAEPGGERPLDSATSPDLVDFILQVGKRLKKNFVIDPQVKGKVELGNLDADKLSYHAFLEILYVRGYAALPSDDVITIVPSQRARVLASQVVRAEDLRGDGAEVVTALLTVPARDINLTDLVARLRQFLSEFGNMIAMPEQNAIVIVDRISNIQRLMAIIKGGSRPP